MSVTIYHNPRCSKSRATLSLLEERGEHVQIVKYLETPPSAEALRAIVSALGLAARDLMRKGETVYKDLGLAEADLSEEALIRAMSENPILIERPIVVKGEKAALGRPPEAVLDIL